MNRRKILSYLGLTSVAALSGAKNASAAKPDPKPEPTPTSDQSIRYVSVHGDDTNDGLSWETALFSLSVATEQLTTGGTIYLSGGQHSIGTIDIVNANINIIGAGMDSTFLRVLSGHNYGIKFTVNADSCSIRELTMQGNATEHQIGVYIDDREFIHLDRVRFRVFGIDRTDTADADTGACGIYVIGTNKFSDWLSITNCDFWQMYRGMCFVGGGNGFISNTVVRNTVKEHVYILKRDNGTSPGTAYTFNSCWFAGVAVDEYMVRMEYDPSAANRDGYVRFQNCTTEPNTTGHHFYCDLWRCQWINHQFTGGGPDPIAIYFTSNGRHNILGQYVAVGSGNGAVKIVDTDADIITKNNQIWSAY